MRWSRSTISMCRSPSAFGSFPAKPPSIQRCCVFASSGIGNPSGRPGAPGRPLGFPIPEEAKTQQRWIEGGLAGNDPNAEGDRHMLIVDRDHRILYELYALHWTGSRWERSE